MTQRDQLLQAFQTKGELFVYEIMAPRPDGLGIAQYNARIKELREQGHPIINTKPGHFVYLKNQEGNTMSDTKVSQQTYARFQQMGSYLKGKAPKPEDRYKNLDLEELIATRKRAVEWLKNNESHPKYGDALKRLESIEDQISLLEGRWIK